MLTIKPTPNLSGLAISGDLEDISRLYDALMAVLGDDDETGGPYELPTLYILALCYELRHAYQGDRWLDFVDNGFNETIQQRQKKIAPQRNVYFQTRIELPEILFDLMVLSDFTEQYSAKIKGKLAGMDCDLLLVRWFQAEGAATLGRLLDDQAANRLKKLIYGSVPRFQDFYTQYVDYQTSRYLKLSPGKRLQQILPIARRYSDRGADYQRLARDLEETAAELHCGINDLQPIEEPRELADADW